MVASCQPTVSSFSVPYPTADVCIMMIVDTGLRSIQLECGGWTVRNFTVPITRSFPARHRSLPATAYLLFYASRLRPFTATSSCAEGGRDSATELSM